MGKKNFARVFDLTPCGVRQKSFYGKAVVYDDGDGVRYLISYETPVAYVDDADTVDGLPVLHRLWSGYTPTTGRHLRAFSNLYSNGAGGVDWWRSLPVEDVPAGCPLALTGSAGDYTAVRY